MKAWEKFLTNQDKDVFGEAGYDVKAGLGKKPAILIVDVNYAFCGDKPEPILESIKTWRNSCGMAAWEALPHIQNLLATARDKHIPVVYTTGKDLRDDGFDAGGWRRKNSRASEGKAAVNIRGNEIMKEIEPIPSDIVIEKLKPSAFHGTPLLGYLVDLGIDSLLICGTTTSGCVRASVIDAFSYNFKVGIVEECTFDRGEASHAINLFDMNAKYADVVNIEEASSYLKSLPTGLYDDKIAFKAMAAK
ncbi:isochorismatase family protein [Domibacillus epiphyticus]|uniref:Hydrolase n=1 Tax=Domibacillus epiphyticus TaxID=1714355 RepID=A0A1V2A5Q4_9BACI|nr:isochorismatase family protein [Domibacillus epiphyticus]OMP66257.1 hydrolase [Domibacillus epiphyticus]